MTSLPLRLFCAASTGLTLAVVGIPSALALCSASFFTIRALSSSVFCGTLPLPQRNLYHHSAASRHYILYIWRLVCLRLGSAVPVDSGKSSKVLWMDVCIKGVCLGPDCKPNTTSSSTHRSNFWRFFSSAFSFWAEVRLSASARLSTAIARNTFRRMTERLPSREKRARRWRCLHACAEPVRFSDDVTQKCIHRWNAFDRWYIYNL